MSQANYYRSLLRASAERRSPKRAMQGEIRRRVARTLAAIRFKDPPTDLEAVARYLEVEAIRITTLSMRGRLIFENGGDVVIEINNALPALGQRQVLAHELAHLLLEPDRLTKSATLGRTVRVEPTWRFHKLEERCEETAAELLIPTDWLLAHQPATLSQAAKQAIDANVELELFVKRLVDLSIWPGDRLWWISETAPHRLVRSYPSWDDDFLARVSIKPRTQELIASALRSSDHETGRIWAVVEDESVDYPAEALRLSDGCVLVRVRSGGAPN